MQWRAVGDPLARGGTALPTVDVDGVGMMLMPFFRFGGFDATVEVTRWE